MIFPGRSRRGCAQGPKGDIACQRPEGAEAFEGPHGPHGNGSTGGRRGWAAMRARTVIPFVASPFGSMAAAEISGSGDLAWCRRRGTRVAEALPRWPEGPVRDLFGEISFTGSILFVGARPTGGVRTSERLTAFGHWDHLAAALWSG